MAINAYLSTNSLTAKRLNVAIKRCMVTERLTKQDLTCAHSFHTTLAQDTHFRLKDTQTGSKGIEKDTSWTWKQKKKLW